MLHLNLFNIVILFTLKVDLGYHQTRIGTIQNIFKINVSKLTLKQTGILWYQLAVDSQNIIPPRLFIITLVMYQLPC